MRVMREASAHENVKKVREGFIKSLSRIEPKSDGEFLQHGERFQVETNCLLVP